VTTMSLHEGQLVKRLFNVSAILIYNTLQTTSPFTTAVISEVLWQCTPLQHDCLLHLINGVKLLSVVDLLLQDPPNGIIHQV